MLENKVRNGDQVYSNVLKIFMTTKFASAMKAPS